MGLLDSVVDGRDVTGKSFRDWVRDTLAPLAARLGGTIRPMDEITDEPPLVAFVNAGQWVVRCPDCAGAELVWAEDPLLMCGSCFNRLATGRWRRVEFPAERYQIEKLLNERPLYQTRNWLPGETLADLAEQNVVIQAALAARQG